jgi:hypothetical protein
VAYLLDSRDVLTEMSEDENTVLPRWAYDLWGIRGGEADETAGLTRTRKWFMRTRSAAVADAEKSAQRTDMDILSRLSTRAVVVLALAGCGPVAADVAAGPGPTNYMVQPQRAPGSCLCPPDVKAPLAHSYPNASRSNSPRRNRS